MHRAMTPLTVAPMALAMILATATSARADEAKEKVAWLGVQVEKADETVREQLKLGRAGLSVHEVVAKSPAEETGLKQYDVLEKLDDQILFNGEQLAGLVRSHKPGDKVTLSIIRQGQPQKLEVTLGETEVTKTTESGDLGELFSFGPEGNRLALVKEVQKENKVPILGDVPLLLHLFGRDKPGTFLGVEAKPVDSSLAAQLGLKEDTGVLVGHVVDDSPAEKAGLKEHDVILKLDKESVQGPSDFVKRIQAHKKGDKVKLELLRGGKRQEIEATLGEQAKPESRQIRKFLRDYRVVPRVEVIEAPDKAGETVVVLKTAEVLDDQIEGAERPKQPSAGRVVVRSTATGKGKAVQVHAGSSVQSSKGLDTFKNSVITLRSDDGVITLQDNNGHRVVVVKDPQDKTVFEGALDSKEDQAKAPPEVRKLLEKLQKLESDFKAKPVVPSETEEIRVRVPKRQPGFIQYGSPSARPSPPTLL